MFLHLPVAAQCLNFIQVKVLKAFLILLLSFNYTKTMYCKWKIRIEDIFSPSTNIYNDFLFKPKQTT
jgi:hypothetical protein